MREYNLQPLSDELIVQRYGHGIKLIRPESRCSDVQRPMLSIKELHSHRLNTVFQNENSQTVSASDATLDSLNMYSMNDLLGKSVVDFSQPQNAQAIIQINQSVIKKQQHKLIDEHAILNDGTIMDFVTIKMPWYDEHSELKGIFGISMQIGRDLVAKSLRLIKELNFYDDVVAPECDNRFSKREHQVIYYLLRGKSASQVGKLLFLSTRTVEDYINNIKNKLKVTSKSELIETLMLNGSQKYYLSNDYAG